MPVLKGALLVFGLFLLILVALVVMARGGEFAVQSLTKFGMFVLGAGLATTAIGCGLIFLGRVALAHLGRVFP